MKSGLGISQVRKKDQSTFYCFSPPVMMATFIIEIGLALYIMLRYAFSRVTGLAVLLLVALGIFQMAEYMVCRGIGDNMLWSRIGFVAITILPPVGLHLLQVISKTKKRWLALPGYGLGTLFVLFFMLSTQSIVGNQCMGNYVIFQVGQHAGFLYGAYYYGLLIASLVTGWCQLRQKHSKKTKRAIGGLMIGYSIFLIPTTAAALAEPGVLSAIPSVMCGFAVLLALVLGLVVLPQVAQRKRND